MVMRSRKSSQWITLAVIALAGIWLVRSVLLPVGGAERITVQIPRGASTREIGHILAARGVVRSSLGFGLLARATGKSGSLKPGAYDLSPAMTPLAVMDKIARGEVCAKWITFPEGFTIRQVAERLEAEEFGKADSFWRLARYGGASFSTGFPHPAGSLEGYLFPDTYLLSIGISEEAVIREMLDCFERKVATPLAAEISRSGMSLHEVLTVASLIEREARIPKDRSLISAVLHNRLRRNMRLECDASVLYALGRHKSRVLYKDLTVDSPYNTYLHGGLPPGPIANPGLASIKAALHPAQVDYLYYVARPDGSHIFSRTMAEHQRARAVARGKAAR